MFKQKRRGSQLNATRNLPAPFNGFDASSSLMLMKPTAASLLENFFPLADGLETRDGTVDHLTGLTEQPERLHVYSAATGGESLWVTTATGVYDASTAGPVGAAVIALTNGDTVSTSIATGAGNYMILANGVDTVKQYDGAAWTSVAVYGATNTATLSYCETYRQRLFFVVRNSLDIFYLASNAIAGAGTTYPLGALFRLGGYIVAMAVWTIDGGIGPEDNLAVITNKGEVAVFAGNDPSTWSLRGVYFAGRPMGKTPLYKYGGDVLIIGETGIVPLSTLIQTASIDRTQTVSNQIRPAIALAASQFPSEIGWQIISDPIKPMLVVNIPAGPLRLQFIMNSQTGAWTTYTGWNARYFARRTSELYFTETGSGPTWNVVRVTGTSDKGANIVATMLQAYNTFGSGAQKKVEEVRPYFFTSSQFQFSMGWANDLQDPRELTTLNMANGLSGALWGSAIWGAAFWSGAETMTNDYETPPDLYGTWKAFYLQTTTRLAKLKYIGADLILKSGGHF